MAAIVRNLPWSLVRSLESTSLRPPAAAAAAAAPFYKRNSSASGSASSSGLFSEEPYRVSGLNCLLSSCPSPSPPPRPRMLTNLKSSWKVITLCHTFLLVSEVVPISKGSKAGGLIAGAAAMSTSSSFSPTPDDVLEYWFKDVDPQKGPYGSMWWFIGGDAVDAECRTKFGVTLKIACSGGLNEWMDTGRGRLALVILLDQFSRNIYRKTPQSFSQDERAIKITLDTIEKGWDKEVPPWQRWFFYLPFMHSEKLDDHATGTRLFQGLVDETSTNEELNQSMVDTLNFQKQHTAVLERFGRYPSRNAILGRPNTKEEEEFLANRDAGW